MFPYHMPSTVAHGTGNCKDDPIPIFSYIYRVTDLGTSGSESIRVRALRASRMVPNDKVPKGLAAGRQSECGDDPGTDRNRRLRHQIAQDRPTQRQERGARGEDIRCLADRNARPPAAGPDCTDSAVVRAGDILLLGDLGYKVRNIVPKDDKTKAIGWVEFTLDPIKKSKLEHDKVPFIVPKPVKGPPP